MHKAVVIGLLSLLVGLFSIATINNIFSNVMAIEEYYYQKDDYYDIKVNKYECQKGAFEGFYTSSPEFCKKELPTTPIPPTSPTPPINSLDLAVANTNGRDVSILLGTGNGNFGPKHDFRVGDRPGSVAVGLFNADSFQDLAVANSGDRSVSILLGRGDGTFGAQNNVNLIDRPFSVAVGLFNEDSLQDLAVAELRY